MTENLYNIEEVEKRTNLKPDFIRRCIRFFKEELAPHTIKTDNNSLAFNSSALAIFDSISQYKNQKLTLPAIKSKLQIPTKPESETYTNPTTTITNPNNENLNEVLFNELKEYRKSLVGTQQELNNLYQTLIDKEKVIEVQNHQLKLLTDGRSPEEVKAEFINKEISLRTKEMELEHLKSRAEEMKENLTQEKTKLEETSKELNQKEKELLEQKNRLTRLEEEKRQLQKAKEEELQRLEREKNQKLLEQEKLLKEKEEKAKALEKEKFELEEKAKEKEKRKQEIIKELEGLEGKWFVGTKRKELFKQLQDLG